LCEYSTFQLAALKKHIECVHENYKQHQCKICEKSFGHKGVLNRHVQSIHANK
jgi:uncharacterized Zn-finger protein